MGRFAIVFGLSAICCTGGVKGSGVEQEQQRKVDAFTEVDVSGAFDIRARVGSASTVTIKGDDNIVSLVKTEVIDGRLEVSTKERISPRAGLIVVIESTRFESFDFSGAIEAQISGLDNDSLRIDASGATDITAQGRTSRLEVDISGAGELDAKQLEADDVTIDISGAGEADLIARKSLDVEISGAGTIQYAGTPTIKKSISGAGSITATN